MIERLYPGVYVVEVPFEAKPIDGVPTAHPAHTPEWTNLQAGDPGVTQLELFAFLADSLLYRTDLSPLTSRYIGETEKNLSVLFDAADTSSPVLFYEESDSLFDKKP